MKSLTEAELVQVLQTAYNLGSAACKSVNFGRKGFTRAMATRERATLNRLMAKFGAAKLTDEEYHVITGD